MVVLVQTPKLEVLKCIDTLASGKLGQIDLTRPKSEEDDTNTGPPVAVSPEMENMRFSNYPYVGRAPITSTFAVDSYRNNVLAWGLFMTSSMKAANHLGRSFQENLEITQKLMKEQLEEILNVKTLDTSHPHGQDQHFATISD